MGFYCIGFVIVGGLGEFFQFTALKLGYSYVDNGVFEFISVAIIRRAMINKVVMTAALTKSRCINTNQELSNCHTCSPDLDPRRSVHADGAELLRPLASCKLHSRFGVPALVMDPNPAARLSAAHADSSGLSGTSRLRIS